MITMCILCSVSRLPGPLFVVPVSHRRLHIIYVWETEDIVGVESIPVVACVDQCTEHHVE